MKTSASTQLLPFDAEEGIKTLGERISLARRSRHLTQADLAEQIGVGVSTMASIERGSPSVQAGYYFAALWGVGLLDDLRAKLGVLGAEAAELKLLASHVPQRVYRRRP